MRITITALTLPFLFACSSQSNNPKKFLENYSQYCGYAYEGSTNFVDLSSGDLFEHARLIINLTDCEDDEIRIPFHIDEDTSRTWIVKMTSQGLHLSHDHRYPDGKEYDNNFYGGYADHEGSSSIQYFPADQRTVDERPARAANRWAKEIDTVNHKYYYRLYLNGELRLETEFDLSQPIEL
ncbi:hypothetical protein [Rhodohalobacter halophilus]|uniref:hypothetical protein n=1 Tax=Rhodohalobacter halophilus TaxID=1812810 RepID=UPI00083FA2FF|nr:hypothetical protein [Rhodohalobacter halophilus]